MKKQRITKIIVCLMVVLLCLVGASGCEENGSKTDGQKEPQNKIEDEGKQPVDYVLTATLYFINNEYVDSGNETLPHLIGPIEYIEEDKVEQSDPSENPYREVVDLLLRMDVSELDETLSAEQASTLITDDIIYNDVTVSDGVATVDIKAEEGALNGGSLEERLLIEQITFSLIDSFEDVDKVKFVVNGGSGESLMGHMDISEPFTKESFAAE